MYRLKITPLLTILLITSFALCSAFGQDPERYHDVVNATLQSALEKHPKSPIIFTGSAHLNGLSDLDDLPDRAEILDLGFEGSQTSDLIYFANELVLSHKPSKIFIYEGDNDLAEGKSVDIVLADMKTLFHVIRRQLPDTPIYLTSPKPSPARLALRPKYEELNYLLSYLCPERDITFINLWDEMIDEFG
ncbi:MAG: GDSL-type esterase/lipase family protein, partial [Bacteroidota bacterium]